MAMWLIGVIFLAGIAGCTTSDKKPTMVDSPVVKSKASGEVYLAINHQKPKRRKFNDRYRVRHNFLPDKCTVVKLKDRNGSDIGQLVSPMSPGDLLLEILKQELSEVGYTVRIVHILPERGIKGVEISGIYPEINLFATGVRNQADAKLSVRLNVWRYGVKARSADYEAQASDSESGDRALILKSVMDQGLQGIAKQALPDILQTLAH